MKKIIIGLLGLTFATAVYANCRTHTITTSDGRMVRVRHAATAVTAQLTASNG